MHGQGHVRIVFLSPPCNDTDEEEGITILGRHRDMDVERKLCIRVSKEQIVNKMQRWQVGGWSLCLSVCLTSKALSSSHDRLIL